MDQFTSDPFSGRVSDDPASQRNAVRDSLFLAATLRIDQVEVPVRVRNLSAGGLMAEYADRVESGLPVEINVRGASVMGFVGAGGIGQELVVAGRKFSYSDVSAILLMIIVTVFVIDIGTGWLRGRLFGKETRS